MCHPKLSIVEKPQPYLASKWTHLQALVQTEELKNLFSYLPSFFIYPFGRVVEEEDCEIEKQIFIEAYENMLKSLEQKIYQPKLLRNVLPCFFTNDRKSACLYFVGDKKIVQILQPCIQVQIHSISISKEEKKIRSNVFGENSIFWGLQFSYPQIFQDAATQEFFKVDQSFSNTALFSKLKKWMREFTRPTPFIIENQKINYPIRLGKDCFPWISQHFQLSQHHLSVEYAN